jgi:hypothetical protein
MLKNIKNVRMFIFRRTFVPEMKYGLNTKYALRTN